MGYAKIPNLYKDQAILMFKRCFALEKIHGTSAHFRYKDGQLTFSSGGVSHSQFVACFDVPALEEKCAALGLPDFKVHGEAYGGKMQGMSKTYGPDLKFVCFDVKIDDCWISVPQAESFCNNLGLEFVHYVEIDTDIALIDQQRDAFSIQAERNGCGSDKKREGVVLRPLIEVSKNNGVRICAKHKHDDFRETKTPREIDPEKMRILSEANAVSEEWVTPMRLSHVLDKIDDPCMEKMREIIFAMTEDVKIEGEGEIVWSKAVEKAIDKKTAQLTKQYFQNKLHQS